MTRNMTRICAVTFVNLHYMPVYLLCKYTKYTDATQPATEADADCIGVEIGDYIYILDL